ncbi:MAG: precorrin-6y C5,15-methyltransferase (decarboxylating) subunit CbiE [bacterium]
MALKKILVIGMNVIGEPVSRENRQRIMAADVLAGGKRHLEKFSGFAGKTIEVCNNIKSLLSELEQKLEKGQSLAVVTTGDPLLFGLGNTLINCFGAERVEVVPGLSAPQAAAARLGLPMDGTLILSRHAKKKDDLNRLRYFPRGVVLTENGAGPGQVIKELLKKIPEAEKWRGAVCQRLGMPGEEISRGELTLLAEKLYPATNLLVVENPSPEKMISGGVNFGRPDEAFDHSANLLTHAEVRSVTLSRLELAEAGVMWDVGAGSGSVGVEAALLNPRLSVFAIEKNPRMVEHILKNIGKLKASGVKVKQGNALEVCPGLPRPDRVFVGGGGRDLEKILDICCEALKSQGIMVINTVTLDSAEQVRGFAGARKISAVTVQVSRMKDLAGYGLMAPENPVTIFKVRK